MNLEQNKAIVRGYLNEIANNGNMAAPVAVLEQTLQSSGYFSHFDPERTIA
jgi:hypothetical protein